MILTEKLIRAGLTKGIGCNSTQHQVLGTTPKKGWIDSLIGTEISDEKYQRFLSLKGASKKTANAPTTTRQIKTCKNAGKWGKKQQLKEAQHECDKPLVLMLMDKIDTLTEMVQECYVEIMNIQNKQL